MAIVVPNLGLTVWNAPTDPYVSSQLAENWYRIDEHDHSFGKGRPLSTTSLLPASVTATELGTGAVTTAKIADLNVTDAKLAVGAVSLTKLAAESKPPTLELTLPTSPFEGQLVHLQTTAMLAVGAIWSFRYVGAAPTAYKWLFVGGMPMDASFAGLASTASTSYVDLTGIAMTAPLAGEYRVTMRVLSLIAAAGAVPQENFTCPATAATVAADADSIYAAWQTTATTVTPNGFTTRRVTATAGESIKARSRQTAASAWTHGAIRMSILPTFVI